jgi:hypothetical protein
MMDYYALPQDGQREWPGRAQANIRPHGAKAQTVEDALSLDVANQLGANFDRSRFIPFIIMHEFEGLLFSNCTAAAEAFGRADLEASLQEVRDQFQTPEHINDSPVTAPSKRLLAIIPSYEKPIFGALAALAIGLDAIRAACPNFDTWLTRLEAWAQQNCQGAA